MVVKAVDNTDVQNFSGFMLGFLHLQGLAVGAGRRLLAEDVFARAQAVNRDGSMHIVGGADGDCLDLPVGKDLAVIRNRLAAMIFFYCGKGSLGDNVAEVGDFCIRVADISGDVGGVCKAAAADNCYLHFIKSFQNLRVLGLYCELRVIPGQNGLHAPAARKYGP